MEGIICLPASVPTHRQPTLRIDSGATFESCLSRFLALWPQAEDASSKKSPWVVPSPPGLDLTPKIPRLFWHPGPWTRILALIYQGKSLLEIDTSPPCPGETLFLSFCLDNAKLVFVEYLLGTRHWGKQVTCLTTLHTQNCPMSWPI